MTEKKSPPPPPHTLSGAALLEHVRRTYDTSKLGGKDRVGFEMHGLGPSLRLTRLHEGFAEFTLPVEQRHTNSHGTLHGGCIAALVDVVGSAAIMTRGPLRHVSTDINITYLQATSMGDVITVRGTCSRAGGRIAFSEVRVLREARNGEVVDAEGGEFPSAAASSPPSPLLTCVARGRHTKYILKTPLRHSRL